MARVGPLRSVRLCVTCQWTSNIVPVTVLPSSTSSTLTEQSNFEDVSFSMPGVLDHCDARCCSCAVFTGACFLRHLAESQRPGSRTRSALVFFLAVVMLRHVINRVDDIQVVLSGMDMKEAVAYLNVAAHVNEAKTFSVTIVTKMMETMPARQRPGEALEYFPNLIFW